MNEILSAALDAATSSGASYADVRAVEARVESLGVKGTTVESLDRFDSLGFGVRVLVDGAWGYACSAELDSTEAVSTARAAVEIARASATAMTFPAELVPEPVHRDSW
ncbi:MAG: TldD/PmbA family protein, partial [Actinobacteria bacterium]|nr:TldD/PmbA family protein [Actinomycetota bacterium]